MTARPGGSVAREAGRRRGGTDGDLVAGRLLVALRTDDAQLVTAVEDVVGWLDGEVLVCPVGAAPVPAHVHLDDVGSEGRGPFWGTTAVPVALGGAAGGGGSRGGPVRPLLLPEQSDDLADTIAMRAAARSTATVGVVGVRGGIGASITASLLARAVADTGRSVGLVDLCGGLDVVLGIEEEPGPRWADLTAETGPFPAATLVANLPRWSRVSVLAADARGTPDSSGLAGVLASVRRACRVVVLDLPRTADVATLQQCDVVVVVAGTEAASAAGLAALGRRLSTIDVELGLLVRREHGAAIAEADELARWSGMPLLGRLPRCPTLPGDLARGIGPGDRRRSGLTRAVRALARDMGLS